jgi:hypothetical protein
MADMDYHFTDEDWAEVAAKRDKFERENPNHPVTIKAQKYRAAHPELFPEETSPAKSNLLPFLPRNRKREG